MIKNILLIRNIIKIRNISNHQEYNSIIRSIRNIRNANTMRDTLAFSSYNTKHTVARSDQIHAQS